MADCHGAPEFGASAVQGTQPKGRSWLSRFIRNPITIIGLIGSVVAILANAEGAVDSVNHLWHRWSAPPAQLDTNWQGDWKSRNGYHYGFAMQLRVGESGAADGEISWQLKAAPPNSHLANRVGDVGVEYVRGTFDRAKGLANLNGYRVSDPTLLALDNYRFQIKSDQTTFIGMTKHYGDWEAAADGTVIVSERR